MAEMVRNREARPEYWRPPLEHLQRNAVAEEIDSCPHCSSEFVVGARFCHVCGMQRDTQPRRRMERFVTRLAARFGRYLDFGLLREKLGLTTAALVAFVAGVICLISTIFVSAAFDARTVLDWQALQIWRVQWLLAAVAAFLAGILLNRTSGAR